MNKFPNFPDAAICPICGTNRDEECCLVPIFGSDKGNIMQAKPVHVGCMIANAVYDRNIGIIYIDDLKDTK